MTANTHATRDESIQEPLDEEERILMDADTWDWDSAQEAIVEPSGYSISEVRLSYDELSRIERAAIAKGMTVNAYLRYAGLRCALQHAQYEIWVNDSSCFEQPSSALALTPYPPPTSWVPGPLR